MAEPYEIGITLALQDGVSDGIAIIRRDLAALDRAIAATSATLARLGQPATPFAARAPAPARPLPSAVPGNSEPSSPAAMPPPIRGQLDPPTPADRPTAASSPAAANVSVQVAALPPLLHRSGPPQRIVVVRPNLSSEDALQLAQRILADLSRHERVVHAELPGELTLTPRSQVALTGTGTDFDQTYFVADLDRHLSLDHGFTQRLRLKNTSPASAATPPADNPAP